jgi:hypothetical protein
LAELKDRVVLAVVVRVEVLVFLELLTLAVEVVVVPLTQMLVQIVVSQELVALV